LTAAAAGPEPIPWPVAPPSALPPLESQAIAESWRLHWEPDPTVERKHATGKYRFDAPAGEFGVTYVSYDRLAAFAETYAEGSRALAKSEADRMRSKLWSTRPLKLLRMDDMAVASAFDLDNRVSTEKPYARTQAWSLAWHTWYPDLDGVRFLGRKSAPHSNVCLYLDRCANALKFENDDTLANLRHDGLVACERYNIAPLLYV
jgi:hypothetical protein